VEAMMSKASKKVLEKGANLLLQIILRLAS
jgi:hypothetical protein